MDELTFATLPELRAQLNLGSLTGYDAVLEGILVAAQQWVCDYTRRSVAELCEMGGGQVPPTVRQATLMAAAHMFKNREGESPIGASRLGFTQLLGRYIKRS